MKDDMNDSQLFNDSCFWNLAENEFDKRGQENSSTDRNMFHVELKQNVAITCKNSKKWAKELAFLG